MNISGVGKMGVGKTGVGEMGQIIGETGVGEMGVGETETSRAHKVPTAHSLSLSKCPKKIAKKVQIAKKVTKINLRIISKPHAYLQSMVTTSVKFQENRNKTVGGVAHTWYPLSIHFIKN